MWPQIISISALLVSAFSLSTWLEPWFQNWSGSRRNSDDVLTIALGDSRRLFAKHAYVKADAYFHGGYYPSIFDQASRQPPINIASQSPDQGCGVAGKPLDWIDRFSRHFYPCEHTHLEEDHDHDGKNGSTPEQVHEEGEVLPWFKLAATLDPEQVDSYLVAAFWLRSRLDRVNEAEQFLREGLRANPGHPELLFQLGSIFMENRKDPARARNVWELALKSWRKQDSSVPEHKLLGAQILANLAKLEEQEKNFPTAIAHLKELLSISPHKDGVQKWLSDIENRMSTTEK